MWVREGVPAACGGGGSAAGMWWQRRCALARSGVPGGMSTYIKESQSSLYSMPAVSSMQMLFKILLAVRGCDRTVAAAAATATASPLCCAVRAQAAGTAGPCWAPQGATGMGALSASCRSRPAAQCRCRMNTTSTIIAIMMRMKTVMQQAHLRVLRCAFFAACSILCPSSTCSSARDTWGGRRGG